MTEDEALRIVDEAKVRHGDHVEIDVRGVLHIGVFVTLTKGLYFLVEGGNAYATVFNAEVIDSVRKLG